MQFLRPPDKVPKGIRWLLDADATCWIIAAMMITGITVGQQKSDDQVKVLTVFEVLGEVTHYADTAVAVVGCVERSVSRIDPEFLAQDNCEHPVVTHGHVWFGQDSDLGYLGSGNAEATE